VLDEFFSYCACECVGILRLSRVFRLRFDWGLNNQEFIFSWTFWNKDTFSAKWLRKFSSYIQIVRTSDGLNERLYHNFGGSLNINVWIRITSTCASKFNILYLSYSEWHRLLNRLPSLKPDFKHNSRNNLWHIFW
jgi:hypothetical protein